jgi:hypothetical protein
VISDTAEFPGITHEVRLLLDTGNPVNIICCDFVKNSLRIALDRIEIFRDGAKDLLLWPNGASFRAIGTLKIRWQDVPRRSLNLKLWIHPKVYETTFYVSEERMPFLDLIIGSATIHEHHFLHPVGFTGRRRPTPSAVKGRKWVTYIDHMILLKP